MHCPRPPRRAAARSAAFIAEQPGADPALCIGPIEALDRLALKAPTLPPVDPGPAVLFRDDVVEHDLVAHFHAGDEFCLAVRPFAQGDKSVWALLDVAELGRDSGAASEQRAADEAG